MMKRLRVEWSEVERSEGGGGERDDLKKYE
jgi:hypothetical protein